MSRHRNFGGPQVGQLSKGQIPTGAGLDLTRLRDANAQRSQQVSELIGDTAQKLFVALVANHVDLPCEGMGLSYKTIRRCAEMAKNAAPFYAESLGLVTIDEVKLAGAVDEGQVEDSDPDAVFAAEQAATHGQPESIEGQQQSIE